MMYNEFSHFFVAVRRGFVVLAEKEIYSESEKALEGKPKCCDLIFVLKEMRRS